jgi:uncharacterized membrane protein YphA (DoxX/SURF4 family)
LSASGRLVALLCRLFVGAVLLKAGVDKLRGDFTSGEAVRKFVQSNLSAGTPPGFYRPFLERFVEPHPHVFAKLVAVGETLIGLCLVLGLLTKPASVLGVLLMILIGLCTKIELTPSAPACFALLLLVIATTGAGRVLGIDRALRGKAPGWLS